jgi:hypothetical protein
VPAQVVDVSASQRMDADSGFRWRRWLAVEPPSWRTAAVVFIAFVAGVLVWAGGTTALEAALGNPLLSPNRPGVSGNLIDAFWHLGTVFVLVLPARNRVMAVLAPMLSLGIDADHLFGTAFPSVVARPAHDLFFVALLGAALLIGFGRAASFAAVSAVATHLAVDSGTFPLLAPFSLTGYSIPIVPAAIVIAGAAVLVVLSVHPFRSLRRVGMWGPTIAVIGALVLAVLFVWPLINPFKPL